MSAPWLPFPAHLERTLAWLLAVVACSCTKPKHTFSPDLRTEIPISAHDTTSQCADARSARACWDAHGVPVSAEVAPVPRAPPPLLGYRCYGSGRERRCIDRSLDATDFECDDGRCVQRHPRFPDDGEWECSDAAGAMLCRGGEPASGVAPGGRPEGFWCGPRRVRGKTTKERLCLDLSPDFPPQARKQRFSCHFEGTARVCQATPLVHSLGDACDEKRPCVDGAACVSSLCVPRLAPAPTCWLDADCDKGTCRFGSCLEDLP